MNLERVWKQSVSNICVSCIGSKWRYLIKALDSRSCHQSLCPWRRSVKVTYWAKRTYKDKRSNPTLRSNILRNLIFVKDMFSNLFIMDTSLDVSLMVASMYRRIISKALTFFCCCRSNLGPSHESITIKIIQLRIGVEKAPQKIHQQSLLNPGALFRAHSLSVAQVCYFIDGPFYTPSVLFLLTPFFIPHPAIILNILSNFIAPQLLRAQYWFPQSNS